MSDRPGRYGNARGAASPSFGARLRTYLIAGILVTAPIGVTLWIAWSLIDLVDEWARSLIEGLLPPAYNPERYLPFVIPGVGALLLVALLTLIGMLAAGFLGRLMLRGAEGLLARVPVVRNIYNAAKQIFGTVLTSRKAALQEVVLVEAPRPGMWSIGFVTGRSQGEVGALLGEDFAAVVVPNAPNPITGFLLFVPRRELVKLDMSVEEGFRLIISGGIVTPEERPAAAGAMPPASVQASGGASTPPDG